MRSARPEATCYDPGRQRPLDVYISPGVAVPAPGSFADRLTAALQERRPDWLVRSTADPVACDRAGTANLLGRRLNGAAVRPSGACGPHVARAPAPSGRFVHIEQALCVRGDCANGRIRRAELWETAVAVVYARRKTTDPRASLASPGVVGRA